MEITRVAPGDDFDAISAVYARSWKAAYRGIVSQKYLDELPLTRWTEILKNSPNPALVLTEGGQIVGTASVCPARDARWPGFGEIISIYLLPDYAGRGYGRALLRAALAELCEMGFRDAYLWVLEGNVRARAFYERNGLVFSGDKMPIEIAGERLTEMRYVTASAESEARYGQH